MQDGYIQYMNTNGLEAGCIPPAKPCPFIDCCETKTSECPSDTYIKVVPFSCPMARLKSFAKSIREANSKPEETFLEGEE
jgi:hypothetical protein